MMAGLRERKKEQTRRRISEVAMRLFDARGYEAVTVNEIAEAAGVAKVTLFNYFPTKESLALDGVMDDTAAVVAGRGEGRTPLAALREHYRAMGARGVGDLDVEAMLTKVRVIAASPALVAGVQRTHAGQRAALAAELEDVHPGLTGRLMAAQITAAVTTLQEAFFQRLATGVPLEEAGQCLVEEVELAFDLLEHGFSSIKGEKS
ncbi:helix-turn-helix domain-containing protein [Nonomuraea sp. B12E4]|uniref:TetR/AcrR family transcriptional regulator n=1 Tax=Nonomuraea sp. B12E4 TaxID=3153564 RepID=UPI00325C6E13